uniref:Uncharacterized protein n=1 Tax=Ascaris lumbricoides TaxID=6252 RepID=A0A0M3IFK3_ASCLU
MTIIKEVRILQHQVKDEYDESSRSVTTAKSIQAENTALAVSAASERVSISATQTPTSGTQSVGTAVPGETPHSQTPGEGVSSAREGDPVVPTPAQPAVATPHLNRVHIESRRFSANLLGNRILFEEQSGSIASELKTAEATSTPASISSESSATTPSDVVNSEPA